MLLFRKFAAYSARERRLVLKAWGTLIVVRTLLWIVPYRWIEARLIQRSPVTKPGVSSSEIALAVTRASTLVPFATCLTQAIAGCFLIGRSGGNAVIHFGVAKGEAGFKAHAWLESDGAILIGGREAAAYLPLTRASDARALNQKERSNES
jgi:hypothetical protein